MSSELDLRSLHQPHEPDPDFVAALEGRTRGHPHRRDPRTRPTIEDGGPVDLYLRAPDRAARRARRWHRGAVLGAAAAARAGGSQR